MWQDRLYKNLKDQIFQQIEQNQAKDRRNHRLQLKAFNKHLLCLYMSLQDKEIPLLHKA